MHSSKVRTCIRTSRIVSVYAAVLLLVSVWPGMAMAQIDVIEPNLHDAEIVYGFQTPGTPIPYVNLAAINLWAWGTDDPNFPNASFYAYGLFAGLDLINSGPVDVNAVGGTASIVGGALVEAYGIKAASSVENSGALTVSATGGTGVFDPFILANGFANTGPDTRAYGISTDANVHNEGAVVVTATGGSGSMENVGDPNNIGYASLFVRTDATGISAADVNNTAPITATASGGTLHLASTGKTTAYASEDTGAIGILAEGDATNSGDVVAIAAGGSVTATAETYAYAYADPEAYGIIVTGDLVNSGAITTEAVAGTSSSNYQAFASSFAVGIWGETDEDPAPAADNSGAIAVTATGGNASAENEAAATAGAWGMRFTGDMTNSGVVTLTATGGSAAAADRAWAYAYAFGLYANPPGSGAVDANVANSGAIDVSAFGGTADSNDRTSSYAEARGIVGAGEVTNEGDVRATALAGTAHGGQTTEAYATAHGISTYRGGVGNSGAINVNAVGGTATFSEGSADASAVSYGLYAALGDVNNVGAVTVFGSGGTADANIPAVADANAVGIYSGGAVRNTGALVATAIGGKATTSGDGSTHSGDDATAAAYAQGILAAGDVSSTGLVAVTVVGGTATAETGVTRAEVEAYGIASQGQVANSGAVTVTGVAGTAGTDSSPPSAAEAYACLYGVNASGDVANKGDLVVVATAGTANSSYNSEAYTLAQGIASGGDVANSGDITTTAVAGTADANDGYNADAGTRASGVFASAGNVANTGNVTVTALAGTADRAEEAAADVQAYGIFSGGGVSNTGAVTLTAMAGTGNGQEGTDATVEARGIHAVGQVNNTGALAVTVQGGTETFGLNGRSDGDVWGYGIVTGGNILNAGNVTVSAVGGTSSGQGEVDADVNAWGIYSNAGGTVTNAGDVAVTVVGPTADNGDADTGMSVYAVAIAAAAISNAGAVTVAATGGHMTGGDNEAFADVSAFGLRSDTVENGGAITVTVAGPTAGALAVIDESVFACGISATSVNNTADVNAIATSDAGSQTYALGIQLYGDGTLTNTGILRASAETAYELQVGYGTTTLVDTYNVTLDGDPNDASIRVEAKATLALNKATLTVTDITGETLWNTPYQLFDVDPNGAVTGHFGDVEAVNPDATAVYYTQGTSNAADDTVALTYAPEAAEPTQSAMIEKQLVTQSMNVVHHRMTSTLLGSVLYPSGQGLLVDAGPVGKSLGLANSAEGEDRSGVFVEPYYSRMDQDADPLGYDARLWGFAAGYERQMDNTLICLHAGYGQADIDYTGTGYNANSEDQDILTGGLTGLTRWDDWTLRYGLTGFYGWHDYKGLTGLSLDETETASIDSYGVLASAMVGRIFQRGSHVLLPEVGFNYLWGHRQRYTTEASNPAWDATYSAMDDHDVEAEAALRWLTGFMHGDIHVTPSVSVGVRHLLTDDESTVRQSVPGAAPVSVKSERDRTAMTLSGSVSLSRSRHVLSLAYDGEYSSDTNRHSLWLRYGWQF